VSQRRSLTDKGASGAFKSLLDDLRDATATFYRPWSQQFGRTSGSAGDLAEMIEA
jgi:hypothetical protein